MVSKTTTTYKVAGQCSVKADIYRTDRDTLQPAVVFIHGGCLIGGDRAGSPHLIHMLYEAGYTVVSIDYRLAPETKINGILEDLRDALAWVRSYGSVQFRIDPNRIGVVGESAGAYLTLMSGFQVSPPPKALLSFYGYGDVDGPWYSKPDPYYCSQPPISESAARSSVGTVPISETPQPNRRGLFYRYCRQNGLWPLEVTGHDPFEEPKAFDPLCPVRNVTPKYPPTLLLHGDADTDVPYQQSVEMAKKLTEAGVDHDFITIHGGGHDFDSARLTDPIVVNALDRAVSFLNQHV